MVRRGAVHQVRDGVLFRSVASLSCRLLRSVWCATNRKQASGRVGETFLFFFYPSTRVVYVNHLRKTNRKRRSSGLKYLKSHNVENEIMCINRTKQMCRYLYYATIQAAAIVCVMHCIVSDRNICYQQLLW